MGDLFISIGSTCNACAETDPESASLLRAKLDQNRRTVFAGGLRNTIGFDWHPETNALWGMDIGADWLGADIPPEELNNLTGGGNFGWPWCYGNRQTDPNMDPPPGGQSAEAYCAQTQPAVLTHQAHSSPGWAERISAWFASAA